MLWLSGGLTGFFSARRELERSDERPSTVVPAPGPRRGGPPGRRRFSLLPRLRGAERGPADLGTDARLEPGAGEASRGESRDYRAESAGRDEGQRAPLSLGETGRAVAYPVGRDRRHRLRRGGQRDPGEGAGARAGLRAARRRN